MRRMIATALAGAMALASLAGLPEAAEAPIPFGENLVHADCLHFTVYAYRNRQSTVDSNDWVTLNLRNQCPVAVRNLQVVKVEPGRNLLFIRGSVPGHRDGIVAIRKAVLSLK